MTATRALPDLSTPEAFLAWIDEQPYKYELIMGRLVLMAGGTNPHATIAVNAIVGLGSRLRGTRCRVYNSDFMVRISEKNYYYPDAAVACAERRNYTDRPVLVVEVLSEATRREDLGPKLEAYRQNDGIETILYLHQDRPLAWLWLRGQERQVIQGMAATVEIGALGLTLPMAELYEGVETGPEIG